MCQYQIFPIFTQCNIPLWCFRKVVLFVAIRLKSSPRVGVTARVASSTVRLDPRGDRDPQFRCSRVRRGEDECAWRRAHLLTYRVCHNRPPKGPPNGRTWNRRTRSAR